MKATHREVSYSDLLKSLAAAIEHSASYEDIREILTRAGGNEDLLHDADVAKANVFELAKTFAAMAPLDQSLAKEDLAYACGGCGKGYGTKAEIEEHVAKSQAQERASKQDSTLKPSQRMSR